MRIRKIHLFLALLLCCAWGAKGRVFRAREVGEGRLNAAGLPWQSAYKTSMEINGQQNDLRVYSAHRDEPMIDQLKDQFERQGAKVALHETRDGAQGIAKFGNRTVRILVLAPARQANQLAFLFYPEPGRAAAPSRLPVPEFPGALGGNTVVNEATGSICRSAKTEVAPDQVQAFYAGVLSADGWSTLIPPARGDSRMAVYRKGERICTIMASRRRDGSNRVTVLVKGGRL
ncbi:hypothetical protein PDESU_05697 [Pontiella desulfatans]|uniref:Uncharacterized protein n=1 Tax=Pontiella desulfatans TaxID=2750659 RepID=A0A6C2UAG2_PONDE|nr:hypothetical protein [Pontiella desulfatans]VGO17102.1 hypothetical protein PDESU_05697 [Pontiella desulfatans]